MAVEAAGVDIWDTSDQFHFVYQAVSGDVDVRARVNAVSAAHAWSKAGVMVRSSLAAGSSHGYALVSAAKGAAFQRRTSTNGISTHTAGANLAAPAWVRLVRTGSVLTAYTSTNGTDWARVGSDTVALGQVVYVGVAVTSHHIGMRTSAALANVSITATGLPAGQVGADVGRPAVKGTSSFAAGTYNITAGGRDIWDSADEFHYVYQPISGDVDVVARVRSVRQAHAWSKAGVMIRESLAPGARHAYSLVSAGRGYAFQRRAEQGDWSEHADGGAGTAPRWVRLTRKGALFEAFHSADGATWTRIGSRTIAMDASVLVGVAVTSHNTAAATTAVVDQFKVTASQPPANLLPVVSLTSPAHGSTYAAPATIQMTASAADTDGKVAGVEFYAGGTLVGYDMTAPYTATASNLPAGPYVLKAVAIDDRGAASPGSTATVTVGTPPSSSAPTGVAFTASSDHATMVSSYRLEVYAAGATPGSTTPVAVSDLGKPKPASNGDITLDRSAFFSALAKGNYLATVAAMGSGGTSRSPAVSFTR